MTPTRAPGTLEVSTPSDTEIRMTRVFNAPRQLVFDAYTRPELLQKWMGRHNGSTMPVCDAWRHSRGSHHVGDHSIPGS